MVNSLGRTALYNGNKGYINKQKQHDGLTQIGSLDCYALMKSSFCHLFPRFSVTMEPHCALKAAKHLFKNKNYYHHNANDRFGFNVHNIEEQCTEY